MGEVGAEVVADTAVISVNLSTSQKLDGAFKVGKRLIDETPFLLPRLFFESATSFSFSFFLKLNALWLYS